MLRLFLIIREKIGLERLNVLFKVIWLIGDLVGIWFIVYDFNYYFFILGKMVGVILLKVLVVVIVGFEDGIFCGLEVRDKDYWIIDSNLF